MFNAVLAIRHLLELICRGAAFELFLQSKKKVTLLWHKSFLFVHECIGRDPLFLLCRFCFSPASPFT